LLTASNDPSATEKTAEPAVMVKELFPASALLIVNWPLLTFSAPL